MKKLLIFAVAAASLCACTPKNAYVIEGNVAGWEGTAYLLDQDDNLLDSATVEAGVFRFKGVVAQPDLCHITDSRENAQTIDLPFYLEPGTIRIEKTEEDAPVVSGTPSNDAERTLHEALRALLQEYRNPETSNERREAIETEYEALEEEAYAANVGNLFGVRLLSSKRYSLESAELLAEIAKFPEEMQQNNKELAALKEAAEKMAATEPGKPYTDVVLPTADGEELSLKSVIENPANKYTLLDFWASWCGPCMGEVPHLKKTYDEFHAKGFEIYGVSFDKDRENWLAAVKDNGMNWLHVSPVTGFSNQAAEDYAVAAIPSNFLIAADGTIVAKNLRGEDLYNKIAELLNE